MGTGRNYTSQKAKRRGGAKKTVLTSSSLQVLQVCLETPVPLASAPPPQPNWLCSPLRGRRLGRPWQRLNGGPHALGLTVNEVLSLVRDVASRAASEQQDYISQRSAGLPGGVGAVPHVWYSHPKLLRLDCDGRRDDDLRSVTRRVLCAVAGTGAVEGGRGVGVVASAGSRWRSG